jgi:predicted DNA-binding protein (MmcQ/YjbR family)
MEDKLYEIWELYDWGFPTLISQHYTKAARDSNLAWLQMAYPARHFAKVDWNSSLLGDVEAGRV